MGDSLGVATRGPDGPASPRAARRWGGAARGQARRVEKLQRPVAWRRRCTRAKTPSASPVTAAYSAGSGTAAALMEAVGVVEPKPTFANPPVTPTKESE